MGELKTGPEEFRLHALGIFLAFVDQDGKPKARNPDALSVARELLPDDEPEEHQTRLADELVRSLFGFLSENDLLDQSLKLSLGPIVARGRGLTRTTLDDWFRYAAEKSGVSVTPEEGAEADPLGATDAREHGVRLKRLTQEEIEGRCLEFDSWHPRDAKPEPGGTGDLLWLDAAFADWLEALGEKGRGYAQKIRDRARERWAEREEKPLELWNTWQPEPPAGPEASAPEGSVDQRRGYRGHYVARPARAVKVLAASLWFDKVKPELERAKQSRAALPRVVVADRLLPVMTRQPPLPELDDLTIRDERGKPLGRITAVDATAVREGLHLLGTVPGHRTIRVLVTRAHDQWEAGAPDSRRVAFEGGWSGFAEAIGYSDKNHKPLRLIAEAGQGVHFETPGIAFGGLWTYTVRRGSRAQPGEVAFVLGDALTPGMVHAMQRKTLRQREARHLVPELRFDPPTSGASREREHGAVWTLHRLLLVELVKHAEEGARAGGWFRMTRERWQEMARIVHLPQHLVAPVLLAWTRGDSAEAPEFLQCSEQAALEAGRVPPVALYTLAAPHDLERRFILAGGERRSSGRARGRHASKGRQERAEAPPRKGKRGSP